MLKECLDNDTTLALAPVVWTLECVYHLRLVLRFSTATTLLVFHAQAHLNLGRMMPGKFVKGVSQQIVLQLLRLLPLQNLILVRSEFSHLSSLSLTGRLLFPWVEIIIMGFAECSMLNFALGRRGFGLDQAAKKLASPTSHSMSRLLHASSFFHLQCTSLNLVIMNSGSNYCQSCSISKLR